MGAREREHEREGGMVGLGRTKELGREDPETELE